MRMHVWFYACCYLLQWMTNFALQLPWSVINWDMTGTSMSWKLFLSIFLSCIILLQFMHTGKPTGVAVSHCIAWFQTQLILTTCQIRYHGHCGIIVALDSSEP